ncbi:MAG: MSHA biogenesis protein MshK [Burkholderiales bacterium]
MYKAPCSGLIAVLLLASISARGENLPDPTRPAFAADTPASPAAANAAGEAPAEPGLQSILLSPGYKAAIINGRQVRVGERIGEAKVVEIRAGEVVLQKKNKREVLKLYPPLEKRR